MKSHNVVVFDNERQLRSDNKAVLMANEVYVREPNGYTRAVKHRSMPTSLFRADDGEEFVLGCDGMYWMRRSMMANPYKYTKERLEGEGFVWSYTDHTKKRKESVQMLRDSDYILKILINNSPKEAAHLISELAAKANL